MSKEFYKDKGLTRYMMVLPQIQKDKIEKVAKSFKISQGAVLEVLLDNMDLNALDQFFAAKREAKNSNKGSKRQIIEKMKGLKPEQLAEIEAHIAKVAAGTV